MRHPHQSSLFDDAPAPDASSMIVLSPGKRPLSAVQRNFNRLVERIRRGRAALKNWEAYLPRFHGRVESELRPVEHRFREAQRRIVAQLDTLLRAKGTERLSRRHRIKVRAQIIEVIENLLAEGPDPELEALHERHSEIPRAERQRDEMEAAEALLEDLFGADAVEGHTAQDMDELFQQAADKFTGKMGHEQETRAGAKRSKQAERAAERKAQAAGEVKLSVREIYRKLASALHPDRETDAAEHVRKTALMQRVNQAYQHNDLLELLALQIEIEQIDASALADAPEKRVRHYNQVLLEQARALEAEVGELTALFRIQYGLTMRDVTPQRVDRALSASIAEARAMADDIERDVERLQNPRQRRSILDQLPEPEDAFDAESLAALAAMFQPEPPMPRRRKRRKR